MRCLRGGSSASLRVRVESPGGDIGVIGPDDRPGLGVGAKATEELGIPQRLKGPAVVEEVRQIDVRGNAVLEANADDVAVPRLGLDQ